MSALIREPTLVLLIDNSDVFWFMEQKDLTYLTTANIVITLFATGHPDYTESRARLRDLYGVLKKGVSDTIAITIRLNANIDMATLRLAKAEHIPKSTMARKFRETGTSFVITFRKDILSEEYLKHIGLNTNQVKAVMHLKVNKKITNGEYQKLNGVSRSTAARELSALVKRGIIERRGHTGRGTAYVLKGSNDSQTTQ